MNDKTIPILPPDAAQTLERAELQALMLKVNAGKCGETERKRCYALVAKYTGISPAAEMTADAWMLAADSAGLLAHKPRPGERTNKALKNARIEVVKGWVESNWPPGRMLVEAAARWGVGQRTLHSYKVEAAERLCKEYEDTRARRIGRVEAQLRRAAYIAEERGDVAGLVNASEALAKLRGLNEPTVQTMQFGPSEGAAGKYAVSFEVPEKKIPSENDQ